jgi:hypothetical protein
VTPIPNLEALVLLFIAIWSAVVAGIVGAIVGRAYERNVWLVRLLKERASIAEDAAPQSPLQNRPLKAPEADSRELTQAIDAIAVEVERIGEGQRFLTRLLGERETRLGGRVPSPIPGSMRSPVPPAA